MSQEFGYLNYFSYLCIVSSKRTQGQSSLPIKNKKKGNLKFIVMKNLINFMGVAEYSVNLHTMKMGLSGEEVMFITVTTLMDGSDYTVVLNGMPMPKQLKKICGKDVEAAKLIIKTLKEDVVKYAIKYWNFDKDEWEMNLDLVLKQYKESKGIVETDE